MESGNSRQIRLQVRVAVGRQPQRPPTGQPALEPLGRAGERVTVAMCQRFREAGRTAANSGRSLTGGGSDAPDDDQDKLLQPHPNANVLASYRVEWPAGLDEQATGPAISPLCVRYLRTAQMAKPLTLLGYYRRQMPGARQRTVSGGVWLDGFSAASGDRAHDRSVDVFITVPSKSAAAPANQPQRLIVDVLLVECQDGPAQKPMRKTNESRSRANAFHGPRDGKCPHGIALPGVRRAEPGAAEVLRRVRRSPAGGVLSLRRERRGGGKLLRRLRHERRQGRRRTVRARGRRLSHGRRGAGGLPLRRGSRAARSGRQKQASPHERARRPGLPTRLPIAGPAPGAAVGGRRGRPASETISRRLGLQRRGPRLDPVPAALRTEKSQQLRLEIEARRGELALLTAELRKAVHGKRLADVLPRLNRLLVLKPDHAYAKALLGPVQRQVIAAVEKSLAEQRCDEALTLLEQVPREVGGPRSEELRRQASELAWLAWDLRNAPVIDTSLTAIAERLRRLQPQNEKLAKICGELERRRRLAKVAGKGSGASGVKDTEVGSDKRRQTPFPSPMSWALPPRDTPLGAEVDWLAGFRRIALAASLDQADLRQHPGRFAVACGWAGRHPPGRDAHRSAHPPTARRAGPGRPADAGRQAPCRLGNRPGHQRVEGRQLAWNEKKKEAVLEAAMLVEHAKSLNLAINEAEEVKLIGDTLETFLAPRAQSPTVLHRPARPNGISRKIEIPPVESRKKGVELVEFEARLQLTTLDKLVWDFQPLGREEPSQALLIGAKRPVAMRFLEPLRRAGLHPDVLQPNFVALHNLAAYEQLASAAAEKGQTPFVRSIRRAVPGKGVCPPSRTGRNSRPGLARHRVQFDEHRRELAAVALVSQLRHWRPHVHPPPGDTVQSDRGPGRTAKAGP